MPIFVWSRSFRDLAYSLTHLHKAAWTSEYDTVKVSYGIGWFFVTFLAGCGDSTSWGCNYMFNKPLLVICSTNAITIYTIILCKFIWECLSEVSGTYSHVNMHNIAALEHDPMHVYLNWHIVQRALLPDYIGIQQCSVRHAFVLWAVSWE